MSTKQDYWQCFSAEGKMRRYPRRRVGVRVMISTNSGEMLQGFSNDLSEPGMGFYAKRFEVGQCLRVELQWPGSQENAIFDATVRNCDGFRCGVEFKTSLRKHSEMEHQSATIS